jgi:hypothetical protein
MERRLGEQRRRLRQAQFIVARSRSSTRWIDAESGVFALKGGTAINLFLLDMPRLSVDLDLVFTDHRLLRAEVLRVINEAL